jgi:hypothetical protein
MNSRNWLAPGVALAAAALIPRPALAFGERGCSLPRGSGILLGAVSMAMDAGFTVNAVVKGAQSPGYPDATTAGWQIGLMVPQMFFTGVGALYQAKAPACHDQRALAMELVPLAWSLGLVGHGIWALSSAATAAHPAPQPGSGFLHPTTALRWTAQPATLGPGAAGLRVQGTF